VRRDVTLNFQTDDETRDALRAAARADDCSIAVIIRRAVRLFLVQSSKKRPREREAVE
jgi:hypothetical protein